MLKPRITIVAGPNGAGKSTSAPALLPEGVPYINADEIAKGLTGDGKDIQASRLLLEEWDRLSTERADFAIETTLASRTLAPRVRRLQEDGYEFHLFFFWLPGVDLAIARVADRVARGGHNIPEETIRRRYESGVRNFFDLYQPLADKWRFHDNRTARSPIAIAEGRYTEIKIVYDSDLWNMVRKDIVRMDNNRIRETRAVYDASSSAEIRRVQAAVRAAVLDHKRTGHPVCAWEDGKVVWIQPEDIHVPDPDEPL